MLSIVDYKKRTVDDGIGFLMSRCPALDQVVIGMGKQGKIKVKGVAPDDVIRQYLDEIGKDFHERMKKVEIPKELEPETKEVARQINELSEAGLVDDSSFEALCESALKKLKK